MPAQKGIHFAIAVRFLHEPPAIMTSRKRCHLRRGKLPASSHNSRLRWRARLWGMLPLSAVDLSALSGCSQRSALLCLNSKLREGYLGITNVRAISGLARPVTALSVLRSRDTNGFLDVSTEITSLYAASITASDGIALFMIENSHSEDMTTEYDAQPCCLRVARYDCLTGCRRTAAPQGL